MKSFLKFKLVFSLIFLFAINILNAQDISYMDGTLSYEKKGDHYYSLKTYLKAKDFYIRALNNNQNNSNIELKLARSYVELNDQENAKLYYEKVAKSSELTTQDILNYAEALASSGNYQEALKWYKIYQEKHPDDKRVANKLEGIKHINRFSENSGIYEVNLADFNSEYTDFATEFYKGETIFVSNRGKKKPFQLIDARDESAFLDVYQLKNGITSKIKSINTKLHDGPLTFFDSGKKVMITMSQNSSEGLLKKIKDVRLKMVIYKETANGWEYERDFPYNNKLYSVGYPSYDEINHILYFSSDMDGGKGSADIYSSIYKDGLWSTPKNLEFINTEGDELFPFISNENELYFTSNGMAGLGGLDIYKTTLYDSKQQIYNLGYPLNTKNDDFGLVLDATGKKGFISSNRENGKGGDDIYMLTVNSTNITFILKDASTQEELEGKFTIIDNETSSEKDFILVDNKAMLEAVNGKTYTITGSKEGYTSSEVVFNSKESEAAAVKNINITKNEDLARIRINNLSGTVTFHITQNGLEKIGNDDVSNGNEYIEINNIHFEFDKNSIESESELEKVVKLLLDYKNLKIEVIAYCDIFGSVNYNDQLSQKRAQSIMNYLLKNKIGTDRITTTALGKRKLLHKCDTDQECGENEHYENRRVEFILYY